MVMHIRGLPLPDGTDPDPYVKVYLLPDPQKSSKRKTKAARKTCNPTYNEMLVYERIPRGDLEHRMIHLRVLGDGSFWENPVLGETFIPLTSLSPGQHWVDWHQLGTPSETTGLQH
uniref:C2 domain-containing protein n=1 Tax=Periophthalmus magnuspinnatus TaxID=409849 RepID=A0A3B4AE68_9GOBI